MGNVSFVSFLRLSGKAESAPAGKEALGPRSGRSGARERRDVVRPVGREQGGQREELSPARADLEHAAEVAGDSAPGAGLDRGNGFEHAAHPSRLDVDRGGGRIEAGDRVGSG